MPQTLALTPPPLPGVLSEIADVAGRAAACTIALAHGGDDGWNIPRRLDSTAGRALADLVGPAPARAVTRRFGGEALAVPLARRALVVHLAQAGLTTTEIARRLGMSRRAARRYRRDAALAAANSLPPGTAE